jgi:hypothetical protein
MARRGLSLDAETLAELRGGNAWAPQVIAGYEQKVASDRARDARRRDKNPAATRAATRERVAKHRARKRQEKGRGEEVA